MLSRARPRPVRAIVATVAVGLGFAASGAYAALDAQTIVGTAVDAVDGRPIGGAFVVLFDEHGEEEVRGLTTAAGTFRLQPPPGTYRLAVERIGFEDLVTAPLTVGRDERVSRRLEVDARPIELGGLAVTGGEPRCGTPAGEALELASVWEEARKALRATSWTDRQSYYRFDVVLVRQLLDPGGEPVTSAQLEPIRIYGRHPFRSVRPEDLRFGGWVQPQGARGVKYFAPDADVLLSSSFLERHCFRLVRPERASSASVGIAFEPLPGSRLPDVEGVLWLDRSTAKLRELEYRYVNLDLDMDSDRVGGRVVFDHLPDGGWIVQSWEILTPTSRLVAEEGRERARPEREAALERQGQRVVAVWRTGDVQASPGLEQPRDVAPVHAPPDELIARYPPPDEPAPVPNPPD